jgi:putative ABC transport system permease protein
MNNFFNIIRIAWSNLRRNKGRTTLSIIGITIGIATVLVIFSTGEAIKFLLEDQVAQFGTDYISIEVQAPSSNIGSASIESASITTLKESDALEILKLDNVYDYYAAVLDQKIISYQNYDDNAFIYGVSAMFDGIDPGVIEQGRFFSRDEENALAQVAVLGNTLATDIFGDDNPLGKRIRIGRNNFEVIGVMEKRGASIGFDQDAMAYVPLKTVQKKLLGIDHVVFLYAAIEDVAIADRTKIAIEDVLRYEHDITDEDKDDFLVTTSQEALDILGTVSGAASLLLLLIASVSLVVGSVGIMNIMFVTVSERIQEIGLRKAVGAPSQNIKWQFLIESMFITFFGGIIGVVLGILLTFAFAAGATAAGFNWPAIFKLHFFIISIGVAVFVGLVAGYLPARKAAQLDPIIALRR